MIVGGLIALAWSSDFFVDGAAALAKVMGISPFVVGMVVIGFGTSAPELCVSVLSGFAGHSNLSLGNAYGSCIFNIAVILGVAALIHPLVVKPSVAFVAAPALTGIAVLSYIQLSDCVCTRLDASVLLGIFAVLLPGYCWLDQKGRGNEKGKDAVAKQEGGAAAERPSVGLALVKTVVGLVVLVASSYFLVWGSVDLAKAIGISDLVIGLTIVAVGTSLPELASAVASARRGENEFVLGNIVGSNFFNTLAVVGLACVISPVDSFSPYVLSRDLPLMAVASLSIAVFGINRRNPREPGRIGRRMGAVWLLSFIVYTVVMLLQEWKG